MSGIHLEARGLTQAFLRLVDHTLRPETAVMAEGRCAGIWGDQSWKNADSGSSIEMMRMHGHMNLIRGIEYGKIGAWQRQVDSAALI